MPLALPGHSRRVAATLALLALAILIWRVIEPLLRVFAGGILAIVLNSLACEFVPYAGPIASSVPAIPVGFTARPQLGVEVAGLFLLVHVIEGYLLVPSRTLQQVVVNAD